MGLYEVYEDWFGGDGFYPRDGSEPCKTWSDYNRRLGGIEVSTEDVRRAQVWERAKRGKVLRGRHSDPKVRAWLAGIGFYQRWYSELIRKLRRQA